MHSIRHTIRRLAAVAFATMAVGAAVQAAPASADVPTYDGPSLKAAAVREGQTLVYTVNWTCTKGYTCDILFFHTSTGPRYAPNDTGTATRGKDYDGDWVNQRGLSAGQKTTTIRVPIVADAIHEGNEFFWLRLEVVHNNGSNPDSIDIYNAKITIVDVNRSTTLTQCSSYARAQGLCRPTPTRTMSATGNVEATEHGDRVESNGTGAAAVQQDTQDQQQSQQESHGSVSSNPASSTTASSEHPRISGAEGSGSDADQTTTTPRPGTSTSVNSTSCAACRQMG